MPTDSERLDELERLDDYGRLVADGYRVYVQRPSGARIIRDTLREAADASIAASLSPSDTPNAQGVRNEP